MERIGDKRVAYRVWVGGPAGKRPLGGNRRVKWIFKKWASEAWTELI